ncbi:MAG: cupin domain-containing protein [Alphaproteobacteria bacterium]|nr:cupin domain-containing protein [Alphaproteobacteria bacterium]
MKRLVSAAVVALAVALGGAGAASAQGYPLTGAQSTSKTIVGEDLAYPTTGKAVVTSAIVVMAPGERTILHRHGVPLFAYMLEGELTVDYGAHGTRVYRQGESFMEAMAVAHFGRNTGAGTVRILAVYMGAEGSKDVLPD